MKKALVIMFLALLAFMDSSMLVCADEDEGSEENDQNEGNENENKLPGFEFALAIIGALGASRLLRKAI